MESPILQGLNPAQRAAVEAYETAGQLLRSDDDATYYQQLQSLIQQLQKEGWING